VRRQATKRHSLARRRPGLAWRETGRVAAMMITGWSNGGAPPDGQDNEPWRRMNPPDNETPGAASLSAVLARTDDVAVALAGARAFSTGVRPDVAVRIRREVGGAATAAGRAVRGRSGGDQRGRSLGERQRWGAIARCGRRSAFQRHTLCLTRACCTRPRGAPSCSGPESRRMCLSPRRLRRSTYRTADGSGEGSTTRARADGG